MAAQTKALSQQIGTRHFATRTEFASFIATRYEQCPKDDFIVDMCRGKKVLDLGCIDHGLERFEDLGDQFLHTRIKGVADSVIGVDILEKEAEQLNRQGYNIIVQNVEELDLREVFDVIVAGDLIEHLGNVESFLNAVSRHMDASSLFVLSTPNPFNIEQTMRALIDELIAVNVEHTCWIDPIVLFQLVSRTALEIVDFYWVTTRFKQKSYRRPYKYLANLISPLIMRFRPLCRRDFLTVLRLCDRESR